MKQIWNDTDFTLTGTSRPVRITVDGKEIYKGVLNAYPNEDEVNMLINKVCEPFLEMDYPANTGVTSHPKAYRIFRVEDWDGNLLGTQDFIYDWSYEAFRPVLSKPVNGKLDPRMRLPYTMWRSEAGNVEIDTIEPIPTFYTYDIQAPANYYTDGGHDKLFSIRTYNSTLSGISATISDKSGYLSCVQTYSNQIDFYTRSQYLPTGYTGNVRLYKDGKPYNSLRYVATSRFRNDYGRRGELTGQTVETIRIEMLERGEWTTNMGGFDVLSAGNQLNYGLRSGTNWGYFEIRWDTLIYKGMYAVQSQAMTSAYTDTALTITKSAKTNRLYLDVYKREMPFNFSITLEGGYCSYYIRNRSQSGLTELHIADTVSQFENLPNDAIRTRKGKYLDSPFPVTVHCADGTIIWQPNTYST